MLPDSVVFEWLQLLKDGYAQFWKPLPLKMRPDIGFIVGPNGKRLENEKLGVCDI